MLSLLDKVPELISVEFAVIFMAALPVIELKGAIPMGTSLGLSPLRAGVLAFIGSMAPVPFILFAIRPIFRVLKRTWWFRGMVERISHRSLRKSRPVQKYGLLGLVVFVALPLPGTGVWTGSLAAALLDIRFKKAFPAILLGNIIAGLIVMVVSGGVLS